MYVSGPAWILFSLVGFGRAMRPGSPVRAPTGGRRSWARPMPWEAWALLAATMTLVLRAQARGRRPGPAGPAAAPRLWRRACAWCSRAWSSSSFSFVLAPIMAVGQSVFLLGMLAGRTIRWEAQRRDPRTLGWGEAFAGLWPQTLLGLVLGVAVWALRPRSAQALGRPVLWAAAARRAVRRGHLLVLARATARAAGHLRRARGGRRHLRGRRGRARRRTALAARSRRRPPRRCRGPCRAGRGLTGSSVRPAKADIGCGRVDTAIDRTPAQPSVEGEGPRVVDQALQVQRPVDLGPRRRQQPAADAAAAPGGATCRKCTKASARQSDRKPAISSPTCGDEQFLAVHLLGEVAIPPRWVAWLDLLLRAREQRGARRQVALERRAHRERRVAAHSPGTSSGAG